MFVYSAVTQSHGVMMDDYTAESSDADEQDDVDSNYSPEAENGVCM